MIGTDSISGTLKAVTDYTGFSSNVSEQNGNYLALHFDTEVDNPTITVEIVGGTSGAVTLDPSDNIWIGLIRSTSQSIKVVASADGYDTTTKTYSLTGLTLQ